MSATATKIERKDLLNLFGELKINAPNATWPNDRLVMKAKKLPVLFANQEVELSKPARGLFDNILGTLKDGGELELDGEPTKAHAEKNGKASKKAAKKAAKKRGGGSKKSDPANLDRFGSRKGTAVAAVNAAISKKPKTVEEIMTAAGIKDKGKYKQNHLRHLVESKFIVKDKDGKYSEK